jgi:acetyltransferase-like isoleucine patch superfamily enzyme
VKILQKVWRQWEVFRTRAVWGLRLHRLGPRSVLQRSLLVNCPKAVSIGARVSIMEQFVFADLRPDTGDLPKIIIGDGCNILFRFQCNAAESVRVGRNVLIASNVLICDSDHVVEFGGLPATQNNKFFTLPIVVEDNCWIGQNAVILKGVTLGHDSIVGANSVVTRSAPPYSVVAGNPARVVKTLVSGTKEQ